MVSVQALQKALNLNAINQVPLDRDISGAYTCDLLSWVMAKGENGMIWITVQTHLNVIAVACLKDFACIIFPENVTIPADTVAKATEEGLQLFSIADSSYDICKKLSALGI